MGAIKRRLSYPVYRQLEADQNDYGKHAKRRAQEDKRGRLLAPARPNVDASEKSLPGSASPEATPRHQ